MGAFKEVTIDNPVFEEVNTFIPRTIKGVTKYSSIERVVNSQSEWIFWWDEFRKMGYEVIDF